MTKTAKLTCFLVGTLLVVALAMSLIGDRQRTGTISRLKSKLLYILGVQPGRTNKISRCYVNLRSLEIAKQMWANEGGKTTNDVPSWNDLQDLLADERINGIPICPAGGSYSINRVGERPTCSIGGPACVHSLP